MSTLKGLTPVGRSLVTEDFRRGDPATVDADSCVEDLDLGREVPLSPLREMVIEAMKQFKHNPQKSDSWLAPRVHATVRLTRREAADKRIWEYLTIVEFPNYVRWRWNQEESGKLVPKTRFCELETKNSFARLWWTAELTRNGSDYTHTKLAFGVPDFSDRWQALNLLHHRAAALGTVQFLSSFGFNGVTTAQNKAISKAVNLVLRTVCLDTLVANPPTDADAVREWIGEKIDATTMMTELPQGPDEGKVPDTAIATVRKFFEDLAERIKLAEVKVIRRSTGGVLPVEQTNETEVRGERTNADRGFPAVGTPEWGQMNQRRAELIRKKNRQGLSPDEQVEFERLQAFSHEALETRFPRPILHSDP